MPKACSPQSTPKLRLVVSNPVRKSPTPSKPERSDAAFYAEIQTKSPQVYEMTAQAPSHYLECRLKLEVMGRYCERHGGGVICHFPIIEDEAFNEFVEGDETLYGTLMIQFHMNIMEQLLLFCADHDATGLIIYVDDDQAKELGIYDNLLVHQDQTWTELGEKTVLVIPAHRKAFDQWIDLMQDVNQQLQQDLWLEQRFNPAIRAYLKSQRVIH